MLELLEQLEHPLLLSPDPDSLPTPRPPVTVEQLDLPPALTAEEIQELRELPMPDPVQEIEHRLGLSTTPPSPQTWVG